MFYIFYISDTDCSIDTTTNVDHTVVRKRKQILIRRVSEMNEMWEITSGENTSLIHNEDIVTDKTT